MAVYIEGVSRRGGSRDRLASLVHFGRCCDRAIRRSSGAGRYRQPDQKSLRPQLRYKSVRRRKSFQPEWLTNPYGQCGNPYSPKSATNPYATQAPKLYDQQGNYRGRLSTNPYDPDSVSNPYGRYGNPYSPDSIKNPYGAGNRYSPDSPNNPYGQGLSIYGE